MTATVAELYLWLPCLVEVYQRELEKGWMECMLNQMKCREFPLSNNPCVVDLVEYADAGPFQAIGNEKCHVLQGTFLPPWQNKQELQPRTQNFTFVAQDKGHFTLQVLFKDEN